MAFSIRLTDEERNVAETYAKINSISLGEAFKKALFEKIEDEYDAMIAKEALFEFKVNPYTLTVKEIQEKYNL